MGRIMKTLLAQPASLAALMAWASAESPEDLPQLALLADGTALQDTDAREAGSLAIELCMKHFDVTYSDSVAALAMLQEQTSRAVMEFSTHSFLASLARRLAYHYLRRCVDRHGRR